MLPCLAIVTPAPAAMNAAVVETLKELEPSPPVPTMSTGSSPPRSTFTAASDIARAAPASSPVVTGLRAIAVRNAASSGSLTSPERMEAKNPSASSSFGLAPSSARAMTALRTDCVNVLRERLPETFSRKFASCRAPCGVPMDSGWYCRDSIGSVL